MSTYLKRISALTALLAFALVVALGLAGAQQAYADEGGDLVGAQTDVAAQDDVTIDTVKAEIATLPTDPNAFKLEDDETVAAIEEHFNALSPEDQAQLHEESPGGSGQPYDRVLESARWAIESLKPIDNSTTLEDGVYDASTIPAVKSESSKGKSTSARDRTWSVMSVQVKDKKAFATITVDSKTYKDLYIGGAKYEGTNRANDTIFTDVPIGLDKVNYIKGYTVAMSSGTYMTYTITTELVYPPKAPTGSSSNNGYYSTDVTVKSNVKDALAIDEEDGPFYLNVYKSGSLMKLIVKFYDSAAYDYLWVGKYADRPAASATSEMIEGIPIPALKYDETGALVDDGYAASGAFNDKVYTDADGSKFGVKGVAYKAIYFELPVSQDRNGYVEPIYFQVHKADGTWLNSSDNVLTITEIGEKGSATSDDLVDVACTKALVAAASVLPESASESDFDAYVEARSAQIELTYKSELSRSIVDQYLLDIAPKIDAAETAVGTHKPAAGIYKFIQNVPVGTGKAVANSMTGTRLRAATMTVAEDGTMTVEIGTTDSMLYVYQGTKAEAEAAEKQAGSKKDIPGVCVTTKSTGKTDVFLDGEYKDGKIVGATKIPATTITIESLDKPVSLAMCSGDTSSWYNYGFIFSSANMQTAAAVDVARQVELLMNYPDQSSTSVIDPLYGIDPDLVQLDDKGPIDTAQEAYEKLSPEDQAGFDALVVNSAATEPFGRVLETAVWALGALDEVDNSTTLADGDYVGSATVQSSFGKATSVATKWSVPKVVVKDGKATATLQADSADYTRVRVNNQFYDNNAAAGANSQFEIPVALNTTMMFSATSTKVLRTDSGEVGGVAFQLEVDLTGEAVPTTYIDVPKGSKLVYNGKTQKGVIEGEGYTVTGNTASKAGSYEATVAPAKYYAWKDGTVVSKPVSWSIAKADNPMIAKAKKVTVKASKLKKKQVIKAAKAFNVKDAQGKLTYKVLKYDKKAKKKIAVSKAGKVTVKKGLKKKTYKLKVRITAKGNANYESATQTVTLKVTVK